jgi:hypothetical protein
MTQSFPLSPYRDSIAGLVTSVFDTLLKLPVRERPEPPQGLESSFSGAIYYAGSWQGAFLLECSQEQAFDWAGRLMSLQPPISLADAKDSLGELTNVMAGNLKAVLPPAVALSLPSVVQGNDYSLSIPGHPLSEVLYLEDELGPFRITLLELPI